MGFTGWSANPFGVRRRPPGLDCNHKELNRTNNNYLNLEWLTRQKNIQESYHLNKNRRSSAPKMSKPVYGRKYKTNDMWLEYSSLNEAARKPNLYKGKKAKQEPTNSS